MISGAKDCCIWRALAGEVNVVGGHNRTWVECRDKKTKWFLKIKSKVCMLHVFFGHIPARDVAMHVLRICAFMERSMDINKQN